MSPEKGVTDEPPAKETKGHGRPDSGPEAGITNQIGAKTGGDLKNETSEARGAEARNEGKAETKADQSKERNATSQRETGAKEAQPTNEGKVNDRMDPRAEIRNADKVETKSNDRTDARPELRSGNKGSDPKNEAPQARGAEARAEGKPEGKSEQRKTKDASNSAPEHQQASARDGSQPDRSSSERAGSEEERPTLEQTANFEKLKSAIESHNWKNELDGKVHVFWSGQDRRTSQETESWADSSKRGIGKNEQYYAQGSNWTSAQEQARVFVAERPDSNSRERIMLDHTAMGAEISKAERFLTKEQAQSLWTQASECFAKSAVANFEDHKIPCMIFGRNAVADRTLIKNEFPILEKGKCDTFSDQSGHPSENKLDLGSWTTPRYKH